MKVLVSTLSLKDVCSEEFYQTLCNDGRYEDNNWLEQQAELSAAENRIEKI